MTATTIQARDDELAGQDAAALAALVITDELTRHSLDVRSPDDDGSHYLRVTNAPGALCHVSVAADGSVEWERWPCQGRQADPACAAAAVLRILGGDAGARPAAAHAGRCRCGVSFTAAAGRILAGHGMLVTVRAYPDQEFFEVYSEIEVTNPAMPERGTVAVADDGSVLWRCRARLRPDDAGSVDPAQIAAMIAQALTCGDRPATQPAHARASSQACLAVSAPRSQA
jgi:hypothetical protein